MGREVKPENIAELIECLAFVEDPRVAGRTKHSMIDIIVQSICANLCGAQTCTDIADFGEAKFDWLKDYLELANGVPSHDTIARFLSIVDPMQMEVAYTHWVKGILDSPLKSISIDGKSVAGTQRRFPLHPLHLVNVYSHEIGLSLAQTKAINRGAGEIEGALECMKVLDLKDVTVMADAALTTKRFTEAVRNQEGHYLLPIKGNQKLSLKELEEYFRDHKGRVKRAKTSEKGHGREEDRMCELLTGDRLSKGFKEKWQDVESVFRITRTRQSANMNLIITEEETKSRTDVTYYISSREWTPKGALAEARKHWGIENNLHWILDVAFGEDDWTVRAEALARSLAVLRKIAFNIAKRSSSKGSIRGRIKAAGWNNEYLAKLVFGGQF